MANLYNELTEIENKIKNFVPNIESNQLCNMFADKIDEDYYNQYGTKEVEIGIASFYPSQVWEKLDPTGYGVAKRDFAYNLDDFSKNKFSDYGDLLAEKEEIQKLIKEKENGK